MTTYKESGVDLELGNEASKILYNASRLTWENRRGKIGEVIELFSDFSGIRAMHVGGLPEGTFTNLGFDGVGTKIEIAERMQKHDTVAYDLFAMVCDDAVRFGAEPVMVGSVLDVNSLEGNIDYLKQMAQGYINAAKEAGVAVVNGEIAELGARVRGYSPVNFFRRISNAFNYVFTGELPLGKFNYNWGAGVVWVANKDRLIDGRNVKPGDYAVGLEETGFRSNGLSLVRRVLRRNHGRNWHAKYLENGKKWHQKERLGDLVLTPSRIYTKAVVDMFGGYNGEPKAEIHGIAHITGGGIPEKLGRVLGVSGHGATLDNLFEPPEIMQYVQNIGNVSDEEAYNTWNMGQGMIIITPEPDKVMNIASSYDIDANWIGEITEEPGIIIKSKGFYEEGKELKFAT